MQVKCPNCQTNVVWNSQSPYRPFCSKRCQLIDLGEWANEQHSISADPQSLDEQDIEQLIELVENSDSVPYSQH